MSVASSGVAVGVVTPKERMAGAQGLLGGAQTLVGGIAALLAGELYQNHGRALAYTVCSVLMVTLVVVGIACVGKAWGVRPEPEDIPSPELEPLTQPT